MKRYPSVRSSDTSLAGRVRYLRVQCGLSRSALALASGVTDGWLGAIESGRIKRPGPDKLQKMAGPLQTSYADLMNAAGYSDSPSIPAELRDWVVVLWRMKPPRRKRVLQALYLLLEEDERPPASRPDYIS